MKLLRSIILTASLTAVSSVSLAEDVSRAGKLLWAVAESHSGLWEIAAESFVNPAVNQWRLSSGLTEAGGMYHSRSDSDNPDPRLGIGDRYWQLEASTFTKYRTSTLWGAASYRNGKTIDVIWNETADSQLLYPYLAADSIGGDLRNETYSFSGGYADHSGRLAWGAELSYIALQQYRNVDPRPRNVSGTLDASVGIMVRTVGDYYAGLGLSFRKYKQTNDIEFKSEMGVDKIFHLTGLGNHYNRFAGMGLSTYYDGYRYALDINVYPAGSRGLFASCRLSRFSFDNILTDLNKLPLARVWHNELTAQAGWMSATDGQMFGGASARFDIYRRHGIENLFGDAASSIYPLIGSNPMFADNRVALSAKGRWGMNIGGNSRLQVDFAPGWSHLATAYIEPYSYRVINTATVASAIYGNIVRRNWLIECAVGLRADMPYNCSQRLVEDDPELKGLINVENARFQLDSHSSTTVSLSAGATHTIASRYGVRAAGAWSHSSTPGFLSRNFYNINISFIF